MSIPSLILKYISLFFISFLLSLIFTPIVRFFALKYGFVSYPRSDRWHKQPTALLGGISIYLASIISIYLLHADNLPNKNVLALLLGSAFLFLVGLLDDKFHIRPYTKLFTQIIAACIAIFFGVSIGFPANIALSIPLTLLWVIGITNSFNLLDNIDGLAAGIAAISSLMLFFSSLILSNNPLGIYGLILSGAALGFLPYNFNPAKIFMGDSGSMFLGYSLAIISIGAIGSVRHISNLFITLFIPVLILSVPIFDTMFVMIVRRLQGRKIFEGGRDHTSHRLVTLGISQRKTVLLLYAISIVFGLIGILYSRLDITIISIITFLALVILLFFGFFLFEFSNTNIMVDKLKINTRQANQTIFNNILFHKRRFLEVILDFVLVYIAYYAAYFLRFEGSLLPANIYLLKESLAWLILIKMSVFFTFGLYRGVWRYIGISDFFTIFKVVSLGSIFSILFLTFAFRFNEYSRAVFFIDWLILLFLISGSRFLFRFLGELFTRLRKGGKNIIIFGAGDTGEMVAREIKRNKALDYNVIGFIDDDPFKVGDKIHGAPVLGSRDKIQDLVKAYDIKEIIIAISSIDMDSLLDIINLCKGCGIPYRRIKGILEQEEIRELGQA